MYRLSTLDAGFLLADTQHSPKHVGGVQIFQPPKGKRSAWVRRMMEALKEIPPGFPFDHKLRDKSILSPVLVRDETFDMDYHVRHTVLPAPGTREQLEEMVSRLHANLLDRERPLWEFHLIEGMQNRQFAFYTKIHHAMADGITFSRWFAESGSPSPDDMNSRPIWQRERQNNSDAEKFSVRSLLSGSIELLGTSVKTTAQLSAWEQTWPGDVFSNASVKWLCRSTRHEPGSMFPPVPPGNSAPCITPWTNSAKWHLQEVPASTTWSWP